jgi:hypothetical protein
MGTIDTPWQESATHFVPGSRSADALRQIDELLNASGDRARLEPLLADVLGAERTREYLRHPAHYDRTHALKAEMDWPTMQFFGDVFGVLFPEGTASALQNSVFQTDFVAEAKETLPRDAAFIAPELLSKDFCDAIENQLHKIQFRGGCGREVLGHPDNLSLIDSNVCRAANQQCVLAIPEVQQLAFDPVIIKIVASYLGCCPVLTQTGCWYSKPHKTDEASLSSAAQMFHRDKGFISWIKVFIHLADVDEDAGPHEMLLGTHRTCAREAPHVRRSDDELRAEVGEELFAGHRKITGPRGTVFFEDTTAFHKGTPVRANYRLMLQLEYACSPYFSNGLMFAPTGLTRETEAIRSNCPRMFALFDQAAFSRKEAYNKREAWRKRGRSVLSSAKRQVLRVFRPSSSVQTPKDA